MPAPRRLRQQTSRLASAGQLAYVTDAQGRVAFVLLPVDAFDRVRPLFEADDFSIRETYPLQEQAARGAGWDDPRMDAYDDYEASREGR